MPIQLIEGVTGGFAGGNSLKGDEHAVRDSNRVQGCRKEVRRLMIDDRNPLSAGAIALGALGACISLDRSAAKGREGFLDLGCGLRS